MKVLVTGISPDSKITHGDMQYPLGAIIEMTKEEGEAYTEAGLCADVSKLSEAAIENIRRGIKYSVDKRNEYMERRGK